MTRYNKSVPRLFLIIFWAFAVAGYFFQFPFRWMSNLIVPGVLGFLLFQLPHIKMDKSKNYCALLMLFIAYLGISAVYSVYCGVEISRILRFLVILVCLPFCCAAKVGKFDIFRKIFILCAVIKSLMLIYIGLDCIILGSHVEWRQWAFANGHGDIYLLGPLEAHVQVHGNALLVVAALLDYEVFKRIRWQNIIILLGVFFAGNFAFFLALALFIAWKMLLYLQRQIRRGNKGVLIVLLVLLLAAMLLVAPYVLGKMQEKQTSNAVRWEQVEILLDANLAFGEGLGNKIYAEAEHVSYSGDMYFEMQTLYIVNQIGLIGLLMIYYLTMSPFARKKNTLALYLIYLLFSFWNPYCWDTTHMITLILLTNLSGGFDCNEKSVGYRLFPNKGCAGKCDTNIAASRRSLCLR